MSMSILEITLQHQRNGAWPVVAEYWQSHEDLPTRAEGILDLDLGKIQNILDRQQYGRELGKALFSGDVRELLNEQRMRVFLIVEDDELRMLHWERLQLPLRGQRWLPLCRSQQFLFSRYLPSLSSRLFGPVGTHELRALVLVANPAENNEHGLERFDATRFVDDIRNALEGVPCDVLGNLPGALGEPGMKALCRALTSAHYSILHIVAHGWVNNKKENVLYLTDSADAVDAVHATKLIEELGSLSALPPFIFLASCESADPTAEAGKGGLARRLIRELGIPAVVAMTERVGIDTAQKLTRAFYARLRSTGMLDQALTEAAIEIADKDDATVPALFSRLRGRPLFFDRADQPLSSSEKEHGLSELQRWFALRAPTLSAELHEHSESARRSGNPDAWIEEFCERVLDVDFDSVARGQKPPVPDSEPVCPFPGLRAFQEKEQQFFFGREARIKNLLQKMQRSNFLAVLGNSGTGKSSLVLAGLIPALRKIESGLRVAYIKPGSAPLSALDALVTEITPATLLVVDQFEEAFTLCNNVPERAQFFARLLELATTCRTVISMRADFWGECAPHADLVAAMQENQELVPCMTSAELRSAMEQQAAAAGLRFEADVSRRVLDDVEGEPGAMPLLQHALRELWSRRHGAWLRADEYDAMGGIRQAIARTADCFYEQRDDRGQELVRHIFTRLTRIDVESAVAEGRRDTRQRITWEELIPSRQNREDVVRLVHELADERLVVITAAGTCEEVEVTHEALIQYWPRLRKWLDEDQSMLRQREILRREARLWDENGRDPSFLIHGRRLEAIEAASRMPRFEMSELEAVYFAACESKVAESQRIGVNITVGRESVKISRIPAGLDTDMVLDPAELQRLKDDPAGYRNYLNEACYSQGKDADPTLNVLEVDADLAGIWWEALSWFPQNVVRYRENGIHLRPKRELRAVILGVSQDAAESALALRAMRAVKVTAIECDAQDLESVLEGVDILYVNRGSACDGLLEMLRKLRKMPRLVVLREGDLSMSVELINQGAAGVLSLIGVSTETLQIALPVFFEELLWGDGRAGPPITAARTAASAQADRFLLAMFTGLKDGWLWYQQGFSKPERAGALASCRLKGRLTIVCGQALMDPLFGSVQRLVDRLTTRWLSWRNVDSRALSLRECLQLISMGETRDMVMNGLDEAVRIGLLQEHYGEDVSAPLGRLLDEVFAKLLQVEGSDYRMLAKLDAPLYIDTNPIPIVHKLLRAAGKDPALVEVNWRDANSMPKPEDVDPKRQVVLQLYGGIHNAESMVLGDDDHMEQLTACSRYLLIPPAVRAMVDQSSFVFLGFSRSDPGFRYFHPLFPVTRRSVYSYDRVFQVAGSEGSNYTFLAHCERQGLEVYRGECEDILRDLHHHVDAETTATGEWI